MADSDAREIKDDELKGVTGGRRITKWGGKFYRYIGSSSDEDWDASYLCPNCGRPVHYGIGFRYYCDPCDESWYWENKLAVNTSSGVWKEISEEEYDRYMS